MAILCQKSEVLLCTERLNAKSQLCSKICKAVKNKLVD